MGGEGRRGQEAFARRRRETDKNLTKTSDFGGSEYGHSGSPQEIYLVQCVLPHMDSGGDQNYSIRREINAWDQKQAYRIGFVAIEKNVLAELLFRKWGVIVQMCGNLATYSHKT